MAIVRKLRKLSSGRITMFKIRNRRGYAAVCMNHLTEGTSPAQAFYRMAKAVKRAGFALQGNVPRPK